MADLDIIPNPAPATPTPLQVLQDAMAEHGYGNRGDGGTAIKVRTHAPRVTLDATPSTSDVATIGKVLALFEQARSYRRPLVPMWKRSKRMLYNQYRWDQLRPSWLPSPLVPEILPICEAIVGWMMDQRIGYTIAPAAVPHSDFFDFFQTLATDLEAVMDATWSVNCEEAEWAKVIWDAITYGTGISKTTWDMTLAAGQGDAITRRVSPFTFYPDPQASSMEDANYFIEVRTMSIQELDRRFPGSADLFPSGGTTLSDAQEAEPTQIDQMGSTGPPRANPGAISPVTSPRYGQPGGARLHATDIPGVTVFECWVREHSDYKASVVVDMNTREPITRVYDTWRVIVVAGNHILMNEPADNLWSHGKHPYSRLTLGDTREFWGRSLVDALTPSQVAINRILAALQQNVELTGNPIWKDAVGGQNARRGMTNKPGERITVSQQDTATGWQNPPQIQNGMVQLLQYHLRRMQEISGLSAITRGGSGEGGRQSQGVVDSMQESGFVSVRQRLRNLEYSMRDAGTKRASLIVENYTTPRMMAIAGPGGERTSLALKSRHFLVPTTGGGVPLQYQLTVDAGSSLHTSRQMREDRAIQLFTLGAIDGPALLEDLSYPNWQQVSQRVQQQQQAMAMMGQQAAPGARQRAGH